MQEETNPLTLTFASNLYIMELRELFKQAVAESKSLPEKPSNETLLELYSLYKQGSIGDVNTEPPSNPFDFVAKAKYEAWAGLKGKSTSDAMTDYIALITKLKG